MKDSFLTKRGESGTLNPFDRGSMILNFCYILCGPLPPSLINLRGKLKRLDLSSNENSKNSGRNGNISNDPNTFYSIHA